LVYMCNDHVKVYRSWLYIVLILRCDDKTVNNSSLGPRKTKTHFANGSLPDIIPDFKDCAAFARSRNLLIEVMIWPTPYKEIKSCL
ncbi:hypothetical protein COCMIDRAFT_87907, partial [Bipolaris oryzae ATCC 44560]